jgi:hypothetical protein
MFKNIPPELKLMILGYSDLNTLLKLRLVSKELTMLSADKYLWNVTNLKNFEIKVKLNTPPEIIIEKLCDWYHGYVAIRYTYEYGNDLTQINKLVNRTKNIKLDFSWHAGIFDISSLKGCHSLNLSGCPGVFDVSSLGNVHTLILSECIYIQDVSMLGACHTLDVSHCSNIADIRMLDNVHVLTLP